MKVFQSTLPRGSDAQRYHAFTKSFSISIHAPSRERRTTTSINFIITLFQSTLPRGSDADQFYFTDLKVQISIHAPSRERQTELKNILGITAISIHAPSRERPEGSRFTNTQHGISIHAPSRERLFCALVGFLLMFDFNPRSLAGATLAKQEFLAFYQVFQSTLPRGSDCCAQIVFDNNEISIHAPSRERH